MSSVPITQCRKPRAQLGDKRAECEKAVLVRTKAKAEIKAETETVTARRPPSPYTVHNLDTAITHLEAAMSADQAMAIFGPRYWHGRLLELRSTPGILDVQERRLRGLLDRFAVRG
jgi:hypothetical protein